jgi:surface antigen
MICKGLRLTSVGFVAALLCAGSVQASGLGFLRNSAAERMNNDDFAALMAAANEALDDPVTPATRTWSNPKTGASGTIKTVQEFPAKTGEVCKQVKTDNRAGGRTRRATHTVCKVNDEWRLASSDFARPPAKTKK